MAFLLHRLSHEHVGLKEHVLLAHAGDGWNRAGVRGPVHRVQHVQCLLLMRREFADLDEVRQRRARELAGIHISAIWPEGHEAIRVLEPKVPRAGRAHGHAAQHDSPAVDRVLPTDGFDRLEHVGLARPTVAVLDAAERMQFDEVGVRGVLRGAVASIEAAHEAEFAQAHGFRTAVKDDIEPGGLLRIVSRRNHEPERLNGPVHGRNVSANEFPGLCSPRGATCGDCLDPFESTSQ